MPKPAESAAVKKIWKTEAFSAYLSDAHCKAFSLRRQKNDSGGVVPAGILCYSEFGKTKIQEVVL